MYPLGRDVALWAEWLEAMGLQEATIGRLLCAMETAGLQERQKVASAVSTTFTRLIQKLEAPVQTAIIPAAGGHHNLVAHHVMQRLLLYAIGEAAASGISNIILVLAPGMKEPLYTPLREMVSLTVVPTIEIRYCEQTEPEGLGDAILQAEALVHNEPFAVLLPDDIVHGRIGQTVYPQELHRMMEAFSQLESPHLVAVTSVPKSKMPHYGVAKVDTQEVLSKVSRIVHLIEKPKRTHPICSDTEAFGIVGRYLLQPSIFGPLHELRENGTRPVHLTDALEHLRQAGHHIYAFELEATREDVGEVIGQAGEIMGDALETME